MKGWRIVDKKALERLLTDIRKGRVTVDQAMEQLRTWPFDDLDFAKIDTHRELRKGFPEVIFCQGKTIPQIRAIVTRMKKHNLVMATRADRTAFKAIRQVRKDAVYNEIARIVLAGKPRLKTKKFIAVISAGTADIPVAEEAAATAEAMGNPVRRVFDVGVAGVHRLFSCQDILLKANVIVVVAGMEGALASIVGGVVRCPVIAVPTSVGYGAHFDGLAPLLTMLNCCAPGVAVVNIDNGFGAGTMASLINQGSS